MSAATIEELRRELRRLEARIGTPRSEGYSAKFREAQVAVDSVARAFNDRAPEPLANEGLLQYRRRLLKPLQKHSTEWANRDLSRINDEVIDIAERQILEAARREARAPTNVPPGTLVERREYDQTGRAIIRFHGEPSACWDAFKGPTKIVTGWSNPPPRHPK